MMTMFGLAAGSAPMAGGASSQKDMAATAKPTRGEAAALDLLSEINPNSPERRVQLSDFVGRETRGDRFAEQAGPARLPATQRA
jgi:hypothetical protein